ncbi:hypothetical protein AMJ86_01930 [bacterium SM23_57]|nr:MAG: hypothetical protein AMJ86_01930 [bacterium SM23_57]
MQPTKNLTKWLMLIILFSMACPTPAQIIYVDDDAASGGNGQSWATAYKHLQDALTAATSDEIWVAEGIYRPDENSANPVGTGDRTATFQLKNGVAILGGFPNGGGIRDPEIYVTILSGDLNEDDETGGDNSENSYHIVIGSFTDPTAIMDGFTIRAGNANGPATTNGWYHTGPGLFNTEGSPTLINCTFEANRAGYYGGAVYNRLGSCPSFENCLFRDNWAADIGGAMRNWNNSSPTLYNCTFCQNISLQSGGGIYNDPDCNATMTNCIFIKNISVGGFGGGMYNSGNPVLINCLFNGNSAGHLGGGIQNGEGSPTLINCTFSNNHAYLRGGGLANGIGSTNLNNCIFWENSDSVGTSEVAQIYLDDVGIPVINFSCVQGWTGTLGGIGNIGNNPFFVDMDGADNVPGTADDNLRLLPGSPCLDTGDNLAIPTEILTDLDGDDRILNEIVDMGAYEGPDQGFILSNESIIVKEGLLNSFSVALAMDPQGTVIVTVTYVPGDPDISILSGASLEFNSENYLVYQDVTLTAAQDIDDINGMGFIQVSAPGILSAGVTVFEDDDESMPSILFVDKDAAGTGYGTDWVNAINELRDALNLAATHPEVFEIRVAQGVYTPTSPGGDREATFWLISGLTIKGGYAGYGEPNPDARDFDLYETVLSGDLNFNDMGDLYDPTRSENSYHVLTGSGADETAVLDGFTIKNGNANGPGTYWYYSGGGMFNTTGSPSIYNCIFKDNTAQRWGGAIYNRINSDLHLFSCTFSNNSAITQEGWGGAIRNYQSSPTFDNCTFKGNSAKYGGGIYVSDNSDPVLTDCLFEDNTATVNGGGFYGWGTSNTPQLYNCDFISNTALGVGGGMYSYWCTPTMVVHCQFIDNSAVRGGGVYNGERAGGSSTYSNCSFIGNTASDKGGGMRNNIEDLILINCTFNGNSAGVHGGGIANLVSNITMTNCIFSGNSATLDGGALHDIDSDSTLSNCTLSDNMAGNDGGGIYFDGTYTLVADTASEFSGLQGQDNWYYGFYDGIGTVPYSTSDFEVFPYFGETQYKFSLPAHWYIDDSIYGSVLWDGGWHPHGSPEHWVVRRWISEVAGTISIRGTLRKLDDGGGDGIMGHIIIDGEEVWSQYVSYDNTAGIDYNIIVGVNKGSYVDFAVAPNQNSDYDSTSFTAALQQIFPMNFTTVSNSILWNNTANNGSQIALVDSNIRFEYCDIQGGQTDIFVEGRTTIDWGSGNIDVDPLFGDPTNGNFYLKSVGGRWDPSANSGSGGWVTDDVHSLCIDGGNPDIPVGEEPIPNTNRLNIGTFGGTKFASKSGIRIGDLAVTSVIANGMGLAGRELPVVWDVVNLHSTESIGVGFFDAIYLSSDHMWDSEDLLLGIIQHDGLIGPGESYQVNTNVILPGVLPGYYHILIYTDYDNRVDEPEGEDNNITASSMIFVDVEQLIPGAPIYSDFTEAERARYYQVSVFNDEDLEIILDDLDDIGVNELYVSFGNIPARNRFDYRHTTDRAPDQMVRVPGTWAGTYYILAYAKSVPKIVPSTFSIQAKYLPLQINRITPEYSGNTQISTPTVTIYGSKFHQNVNVLLRRYGHTDIFASGVTWVDTGIIFAWFDLNGAYAGMWNLMVISPDSEPLSVPFTIIEGGEPKLVTRLIVPSALGYHRRSTLWIEYTNAGDAPMPVPLLRLHGSQDALLTVDESLNGPGLWTESPPIGLTDTVHVLALGSGIDPGVLNPGDSGHIPVYYRGCKLPWDFSYPPIEFQLGVLEENDITPIDWIKVEAEVRPDDIADDLWGVIWPNIMFQIGSTWDDYLKMLTENARYLDNYGKRTHVVRELFALEMAKATGAFMSSKTLVSKEDAYCNTPGLPLVFHRTYEDPLQQRFHLGPFGRGWSHNYEYSLRCPDDFTVFVEGPDRTTRTFTRNPGGAWKAGPGDYGILEEMADGTYALREKDGLIHSFDSNGRLINIEERNSNYITLVYAADKLTEVNHSNGQSFTLEYNMDGRISNLTDHAGCQTQYIYNSTNQHLISVIALGGLTTEYEYYTVAGAPTDHALTRITFPDATHIYYAYDAQGRLIGQWRDGAAEKIEYIYESFNKILVRDAANATTTVLFGLPQQLSEVIDPLGNVMSFKFEEDQTIITMPDGSIYKSIYDRLGNLIEIKDPLNYNIMMGYTTAYNRLAWLIDQNTNHTVFSFDDHDNLTATIRPDLSSETFTYNNFGNVISHTNRRGQTIIYTYNNLGQMTSKKYPDGSTVTYDYDSVGRLVAITDISGTIWHEYDGRGFLTRIEYPDGHWFVFTYNDAGQRTQRVGDDGYLLNYYYDEAGRLWLLTDGEGAEIIRYEYDTTGRLIQETKGNGTYTIYGYDIAGQILSLMNYAPNGEIQSRFVYTYDENGNRTSMTTTEGTTYYEYDAIEQLIGVTYPDGRQVTYVYDPAGNRIVLTENGSETIYSTNIMNGYTEVGDITYTYDADGNMISKTDTNGTTIYEYDVENRLIRVMAHFGDTWEYIYDALGNRIAVSYNGILTRYVYDTMGLSDLVIEYDAAGDLTARYIHGLGLVAQVDGLGNPAFYTFDALGSTSEITDVGGAVLNSYAYDPFGTSLGKSEAITNPFEFVGKYGVMNETNGLEFMRARFYNPELGRFISEDPVGLTGGDTNFYAYVGNNPVNWFDPSGKISPYVGWKDGPEFGFKTPLPGQGDLDPGKSKPEQFADMYRDLKKGIDDKLFGKPIKLPKDWKKWDFEKIKKLDPDVDLEDDAESENARSEDPNLKVGPAGSGQEGFVDPDQSMLYTIYFENEPDATAAALNVQVVDQLDNDLDWATFELQEIGFGENQVIIPSSMNYYFNKTGMEIDGWTWNPEQGWHTGETPLMVDINADIDITTGQVIWSINAYDPETGWEPDDAYAGFLPPNDQEGLTHRGEGYVTYLIKPKVDLLTGTEITNQASIIFDVNPPIETPLTLNTTDNGAPRSHVKPLLTTSTTPFVVEWIGEDDEGGSGVASYDVYLAVDGSPFNLWLSTADTAAVMKGQLGHTYAFYCVATDNVGNVEIRPALLDTITTAIASHPPVADAGDDIQIVRSEQVHTVIQGKATDPDGDVLGYRWIEGSNVLIDWRGVGSDCAAYLDLCVIPYFSTGDHTLILEVYDGELTVSDEMILTINNSAPEANGDVYTIDEDNILSVNILNGVLANDYDIDENSLSTNLISGPANGTLDLNADGSFTYSPVENYYGSVSFTYRAYDGKLYSNVAKVVITVNSVNDTPVTNDNTYTVDEDNTLSIDVVNGVLANDSDIEGDLLSAILVSEPISGELTLYENGSFIYTPQDNFNDSVSFTYKASDGQADSSNVATVYITINPINDPPVVGEIITINEPVPVGTMVNARADFTDVDMDDTHTADWDWGDGCIDKNIPVEPGEILGGHIYTSSGVYTLTLTVTDSADAFDSATYQYIVVYDPTGGFVTGGGWIDSPVGAYVPDPALTGKATFGFVSKYKKGATVPTGNTEFHFRVADMKFRSTSYQWLVVAGPHAKFKGSGTINGSGDYGFMLTATDGQVNGGGESDKFRIKIWDKITESVIYDNELGEADDADATDAIEGGSIVIHNN